MTVNSSYSSVTHVQNPASENRTCAVIHSRQCKISLLIIGILFSLAGLYLLLATSGISQYFPSFNVGGVVAGSVIFGVGLSLIFVGIYCCDTQVELPKNCSPTRWADVPDIIDHSKYLFSRENSRHNFFVADQNEVLTNFNYEQYLNKSLETNSLFFLPLLLNRHWYLILVDPLQKTIEHYDSLGEQISNDTMKCVDRINTSIDSVCGAKFKVINVIEKPHQTNDHDCGPFVAFYMEERLKGKGWQEIRFLSASEIQNSISTYRFTMYARIGREFSGKI